LVRILFASWEQIVGESGVGSHKYVIFERHTIPELHSALYRYAVADNDITLDEDVIADVAIFANRRARQDVRERPHARPRADTRTGINERLWMYEG